MWKHPPGDEVYRKGAISVFEVDGKKNKVGRLGVNTFYFVILLSVVFERLFPYKCGKKVSQ